MTLIDKYLVSLLPPSLHNIYPSLNYWPCDVFHCLFKCNTTTRITLTHISDIYHFLTFIYNLHSLHSLHSTAAAAAQGPAKGVLGVTHQEAVSMDFRHDSRSMILDAKASIMLTPTFCKLIAYYDNEW